MAIVINDERIEDSEVEREVERLRPSYERAFAEMEPGEREDQLQRWSRDNVIEAVLLRQEARKTVRDIPPADIEAAFARLRQEYRTPEDLHAELHVDSDDRIKEMIELQMRVERKIDEVHAAAPEPSEDEVRRYYEQNNGQFASGEQVRVAHIVKHVNWQTDEATALDAMTRAYAEIKAGQPFETVVDRYTDCADSGGDLGYIMRGQMVEEFEDVVFHLSVGQVSDVFRTRFGFHIAKVYDRKPPVVPDLKDVRKQVTEAVRAQKREQALGEYLDQLRSEARVKDV